jgi:membrane protein implicated in regulation of membrane protease activity
MSAEFDKQMARKSRHVSLVIAGSMVLWLGAQWIGGAIGLPGRFVFLFDLAALAALIYAGVNIYQIWRMRRNSQG